ncbi:hypothetical protein [Chitinibacter tainanensis]|uniref:hypothetical protein n=1 Tax=Chitinibacter tainanensis TaxID=230667 RepID=UPI00235277E8|nr:hypothetical protein [Chitinibacter tainanensis]
MNKNAPLINQNAPLYEVLRNASEEELAKIADLITDSGKGRASLDDKVKNQIYTAQHFKRLAPIVDILEREIRRFGSNSVATFFGSELISYPEMVVDVAKKIGAKFYKDDCVSKIEFAILELMLGAALKGKTSTEIKEMLRQSGCNVSDEIGKSLSGVTNTKVILDTVVKFLGPYQLSRIMAASVTPTVFTASTITATTAFGVVRAPAMLNPIGLALGVVWGAYGLSGPAYRVTIPVVTTVAYIRQTQIKFQIDRFCMELKQLCQ